MILENVNPIEDFLNLMSSVFMAGVYIMLFLKLISYIHTMEVFVRQPLLQNKSSKPRKQTKKKKRRACRTPHRQKPFTSRLEDIKEEEDAETDIDNSVVSTDNVDNDQDEDQGTATYLSFPIACCSQFLNFPPKIVALLHYCALLELDFFSHGELELRSLRDRLPQGLVLRSS